jgi:hypothetical protein
VSDWVALREINILLTVFNLEYTIAVLAECTMSLTQENLDTIMLEVIKSIAKYTPAAFSKDSMPNFFKARLFKMSPEV